jgi:Tol biopolymer transport system component
MRKFVSVLVAFSVTLAVVISGNNRADVQAGPGSRDETGRGKQPAASPEVARLAAEVRSKGWVAFSARSENGDWDIYLMRPDGSERRNLTHSPEWNEAWPQFSRDGSRLLYRRLKRDETIDGNLYGQQGVPVAASSDGTNPRVLSGDGDLPWATWSPDGTELATLSIKGIAFVDVATGKIRRTLPRKGMYQQLTWSPDGKWLVGVSNNFATSWSIARMDALTGEANAVNTVDCCTPNWFPDCRDVIFSWRPPGQKENRGLGWTQLWRAEAEGKNPRLVYGEDGRHIYGGHVSPDGKYVLFTGNIEEDGDPKHNGAPMGLMRLGDAPIIGGASVALRALHPEAENGPVLDLAAGWSPCWTYSESPGGGQARSPGSGEPAAGLNLAVRGGQSEDLAREVHGLGWVAFSAVGDAGDWDLWAMRPDGSDRHKLTDTREFNETGVRVSPDGKRLLYYRQPVSDPVDNNTYGTYELMIADANGANATSFGRDYPWASWGPDSKSFAALKPSGIQIVDVASRKVLRTHARGGFFQQLGWSPDGRSFVGTANGLGPYWNIGVLGPESNKPSTVSETERYNCTPDWMPDSRHVVYSRGTIPEKNERAELWTSLPNGSDRKMLYAEAGRHIYGGAASPDGRYYLFTRSVDDLGKVKHAQTTMTIIRAADTPMLGDENDALRKQFPGAKPAVRLDLGPGWEPYWTRADLSLSR